MKTSPDELVIRHQGLDFGIRLCRADILLTHEETIPEHVAELRNEFLHEGMVKDPIVVDATSNVVLDGMHRVVALRDLGCLRIPICAVDYLNTNIKVERWYRTTPDRIFIDQYQESLSSLNIELIQFSFDSNMFLEDAPLAIVLSSRQCYELRSNKLETYGMVRIAEKQLLQFCPRICFESEQDALGKFMNGQVHTIMTLPRIEKETVLNAGVERRPLPHKITRHVIPARPLGVNVALDTLVNDGISLEDADREFVEGLRRRGVIRRSPGSIIGGRCYEEETFTFC